MSVNSAGSQNQPKNLILSPISVLLSHVLCPIQGARSRPQSNTSTLVDSAPVQSVFISISFFKGVPIATINSTIILKGGVHPSDHSSTSGKIVLHVRKAQALHTDVYNASAKSAEGSLVWRSDRARFVATKSTTDTAWFNAFMSGYHARVGERRKQDAALSIDLMLALQTSLESDWVAATTTGEKEALRNIAEHGAFYLFLYCGSLRGFEGTKVKLADLRRQIVAPGTPQAEIYGAHIGLPLTGRFKARSQHIQDILIPIAYETASHLRPGIWAERLVSVLLEENITTGWVFRGSDNEQLRMSHFEEDFYERLHSIRSQHPELFTEGIDINEDYHIARSFRRGATTRATAAGVSSSDIDYINRWNTGSDISGSGPMRVLYADRTQLTKTYLRFSLAL
jgi:hypothetical protein